MLSGSEQSKFVGKGTIHAPSRARSPACTDRASDESRTGIPSNGIDPQPPPPTPSETPQRATMPVVINDGSILIGGYPLGGIIRRVRRKADLSQRELAKYAHVSPAAIGSFETGAITPSVAVLQRVLNAANYQLVVADVDGRLVTPLEVWQDVSDGAGRRFPAHLDTIIDPKYGDWWADVYGLTAPPETFRRNRRYRDWLRAQSRWEVRSKLLRHEPPPPKPIGKPGWEWRPD